MKRLILALLFVVETTNSSHAQQKIHQEKEIRSAVVIKATPLPFLFETTVGGILYVEQEALLFTPYPCSDKDRKFSSIFPCNNYLINELRLQFDDVSKIKRRNFLFLFPNRIVVKKTNGETYLFFTYRRKLIIDIYNRYKAKNLN